MDAELFPIDRPEGGLEAHSQGALAALAFGARRVVQFWPVLLWMLLGTLLSAGSLALVPALNLFNLAHYPVIAQMAAGVRAWQVVDLAGIIAAAQSAGGGSPLFGSLAIVLLGFAILPLVGGLVTAFLYGGVLLTYKEAQPFQLRRFLWGCWHWFGGFLALGLIQALLFFGLYFLLISLAVFLVRLGPVGTGAAVVILLLATGLWLMVSELARVRLVLNDTRNPFRGIGLAFGDLFHRHALALLGFYAAALLLLLGVQAVFRLGINPRVPLDSLLLALVVQQGFILARLFCRALRLAGLMRLLG